MTDGTADDADAYGRVAGGAAVVLGGNLLGMVLAFAARLIPARVLAPEAYGLVALGVTVLNVGALIGQLGLYEGVARNLPRATDRRAEFTAGLAVAAAASLAVGLAIAALAPPLASLLVGRPLVPVLVAAGLTVPGMVVFRVTAGGFRGCEDAVGRVLVQNVLMRGGVVAGVVAALAFGAGAVGVVAGWTAGVSAAAGGGVALLHGRTGLIAPVRRWPALVRRRAGSLVRFSVPLVVATSVWRLMQETDTLLLGALAPSATVGVYDAAFTLARLLFVFLWPAGFVMLPVLSELDERGRGERLRRLYALVSKWVVVLSLPVFLLLASFPRRILSALYGAEFAAGDTVLVVVGGAFLVHALAGTNRQALTAVGDVRYVLRAVVIAYAGNVGLNLLLVPPLGGTGAALATAASFVGLNLAFARRLRGTTGATPLSASLARALAASLAPFAALRLAFAPLGPLDPTLPALAVAAPLYGLLHLAVVVLAGGVDPEDALLLRELDDRLPADLGPVVRRVERLAG